MQGKVIAVLGATGSVGTQALDVARERGYKVDLLYANQDDEGMARLCSEFMPRVAVMADASAADRLCRRISGLGITVLSGESALADSIVGSEAETVINAVSGSAGLYPTLEIIKSGKRLALANKESLVVAGDIVMERARTAGVEILPVDSEHSAIFQSLKSGRSSELKRILLTASGGPFRTLSTDEIRQVTLADTLAHPTWKMGKRITVDSATLMNKGFEVIEAVHLFGVSADAVEVLIHPESILHSAVEYIDNSIIGEMSVPDMRMCVQYAVDYPERCASASHPLDLAALGALHFERPRYDDFPLLALAKQAVREGGALPAVMNAADEVAVAAFLRSEIGFTDIAKVVTTACARLSDAAAVKDLDGILEADTAARALSAEIIENIQ